MPIIYPPQIFRITSPPQAILKISRSLQSEKHGYAGNHEPASVLSGVGVFSPNVSISDPGLRRDLHLSQ